jgi:O-antigen/teichoic acid export membrane protein
MSVSIFGGALFAASTGIFLGFEQMKLNSFTQIIQAIVRTTLGPLLIVVGFGVLGAVYALVVSTIIGGLLATLLVYVLLFRPLHKNAVGKCNIKATLKPMLSYGLPLAVSASIAGVLPQVFAFTMAVYAGTNMMGNYYVSTYFIALLSFVAVPVANVLFPVFSKIKPESDLDLIKRVYSSSVKYFSFILVPATMLLMLLSTPAINLLFPNNGFIESLWTINPQPKYPYAPLFLSLSCLAYLLVLVGYFTSATLQNGLMHTRQVMKQSLLSLLVGLLLAFFFVSLLYSIGGPPYAVIAGILGGLIASTITVTWASYWNWKKYKAKPDFRSSLKILVASTIASSPALLFTTLPLPNIVKLVGGCMLFVVTYLTVAPAIGAINEVDIANFQAMLSGLGPLSKVAAVALSVMSKICFFCKKRRVSS